MWGKSYERGNEEEGGGGSNIAGSVPLSSPNDHPIKRIKCSDGNREKGNGDHAISAEKKAKGNETFFAVADNA